MKAAAYSAFAACFLAVALTACSPSTAEEASPTVNYDEFSQFEEESNVEEANPPPTAPKPSHRYATREGDLYGYVSAVSEEERKRGVAVGEVHMFRYDGVANGRYRLTAFNASGRATGSYECTNPCVAIRVHSWSGVERWAFNPESVIGAAFSDAIGGHLVAYAPPPPPEPRVPYDTSSQTTDTQEESSESSDQNGAPEDVTNSGEGNVVE